MPQLVVGVQEQKVSTTLAHPVKGHAHTQVEGFTVGLQKKAASAAQQWSFTKEGHIIPQVGDHMFSLCV